MALLWPSFGVGGVQESFPRCLARPPTRSRNRNPRRPQEYIRNLELLFPVRCSY